MAQIAGVLVGFANLANAISRPDISAKALQLNKLRIIITTESGLILIGACLLPLLFSTRSLSNASLFKGLSFSCFLIAVLYNSLLLKRTKKMTGIYFPSKLSKYFYLCNLLFMMIPFLLNTFDFFGSGNVIFVYCSVIFYVFVSLCTLFCTLLYSVLPRTTN